LYQQKLPHEQIAAAPAGESQDKGAPRHTKADIYRKIRLFIAILLKNNLAGRGNAEFPPLVIQSLLSPGLIITQIRLENQGFFQKKFTKIILKND